MRIISLFSGAGGLDKGLILAGHQIIWANDIDKDAVATYRCNIGENIVHGDITTLNLNCIPDGDMVVGGFPCQGFSQANLKRSIGDGRNVLYRYFCKVVELKKPKFFVATKTSDESLLNVVNQIRTTEITSEFERKRVQSFRVARPNQASFRRAVLRACKRCIITNVTMPEVLEAAHIKPFKYNGEDTIANGFAMRTDIHTLFDTGHLRIAVNGTVELSPRARMDYGATVPPRTVIPSFTNVEFLRWRWENYNGI